MAISVFFVYFVVGVPFVLGSVLPPGPYEIANANFPPYGDVSGSDDFMNYYERAIMVWFNMVRMAPLQFKSTYMTSLVTDGSLSQVFDSSNTNTPTVPSSWNLNLNRESRAHVADIVSNCSISPLIDNNCNGTSPDVTIPNWYTGEGWADQIMNAYDLQTTTTLNTINWPFWCVVGLACNGGLQDPGTLDGCLDDLSAPLRSGLMQSNAFEIGVGNIYVTAGSSSVFAYTAITTGRGPAVYTPKIYSGAHIFDHSDTSAIHFMANYYDPTGSGSFTAQVTIGGTAFDMSLLNGQATAGTYNYDTTTGTGCRQYFFTINGERYPSDGYFLTLGEPSCTTGNWASPNGPVTTVTPNPTTATSTGTGTGTSAGSGSGSSTQGSSSQTGSGSSTQGSSSQTGSGTSSQTGSGSSTQGSSSQTGSGSSSQTGSGSSTQTGSGSSTGSGSGSTSKTASGSTNSQSSSGSTANSGKTSDGVQLPVMNTLIASLAASLLLTLLM